MTLPSQVPGAPGRQARLWSTCEKRQKPNGVGAAAGTTRLEPQRLLVLPFTAADEGGIYRAADDFAARVVDEVLQAGEQRADQGQDGDNAHSAYSRDAALLKLAKSLTLAARENPKAWRSYSTTLAGFPPEPPPEHPPEPLSACLASPVATSAGRGPGRDQPVAFIFPGQGTQWPQMGQRLKAAFPVFAASLRESEAVLAALQRRHPGRGEGEGEGEGGPWSLTGEIAAPEGASRLVRGSAANGAAYDVILPVISALQIALVDLLADWGVRPAAVAGHSLGEVAAAYCSGALSRSAAMRVAYFRGICAAKLVKNPRKGDLMITSASAERLQSEYLPSLVSGEAWVAVTLPTDGPGRHATMVSGDVAALDELVARLEREKVKCRRLKQQLAWHTPHFAHLKGEYMRNLGGDAPDGALQGPVATCREGGCSQFSSMTGRFVPAETLRTRAYWADSLVLPVLFKDSFAAMMQHLGDNVDSNHHVFLEIGPHPVFRHIIMSAFESKMHEPASVDMSVASNNNNNNLAGAASSPGDAKEGNGELKTQQTSISYNSILHSARDDIQSAFEAVSSLWCHGCRVDLDKMNFPSTQ